MADDGATPGSTVRARSRVAVVVQVAAALAVVAGIVMIGVSLRRDANDAGDSRGPTWVPGSGNPTSSLNISCFAYRDIDRNGSYDLGDRPFAALDVVGSGPGGEVNAASNSGGFANFEMLLGGSNVLVSDAGTYRFEALPPADWLLTTGDAAQEIDFVELDGSPAGVVATRQCRPYGLAPALTISGPLGADGAEADDAVVAFESASARVEPEVADATSYRGAVSPGTWTVTRMAGDTVRTRDVEVTDYAVVLSRFDDDRDRHDPLPDPVVVDFDGFTTANTLTEIPNGYAGLDWANWVSTHRILYGGPGYVNVGTSGEFVAYNSSGHPAFVSSGEPFDFVGGYFGVAWPQAEPHDIVVQAWRGDELVYADRFEGRTAGPVWFDADYRSITRVEIGSAANWQFVVDDLRFRTGG